MSKDKYLRSFSLTSETPRHTQNLVVLWKCRFLSYFVRRNNNDYKSSFSTVIEGQACPYPARAAPVITKITYNWRNNKSCWKTNKQQNDSFNVLPFLPQLCYLFWLLGWHYGLQAKIAELRKYHFAWSTCHFWQTDLIHENSSFCNRRRCGEEVLTLQLKEVFQFLAELSAL